MTQPPPLENQLRLQIQDLTHRAPAISWAAQQIRHILQQHAGLALFVLDHTSSNLFSRPEVREFLNSSHASKLLYTVPLLHNGVESGRLMAAFADPPLSPAEARSLAQFIGEQLAAIPAQRRSWKVTA